MFRECWSDNAQVKTKFESIFIFCERDGIQTLLHYCEVLLKLPQLFLFLRKRMRIPYLIYSFRIYAYLGM